MPPVSGSGVVRFMNAPRPSAAENCCQRRGVCGTHDPVEERLVDDPHHGAGAMHHADTAPDHRAGVSGALGAAYFAWMKLESAGPRARLCSLHRALFVSDPLAPHAHINGVNDPRVLVREDRLGLALRALLADTGVSRATTCEQTHNLWLGYLATMAALMKSSTAWSVSVTSWH